MSQRRNRNIQYSIGLQLNIGRLQQQLIIASQILGFKLKLNQPFGPAGNIQKLGKILGCILKQIALKQIKIYWSLQFKLEQKMQTDINEPKSKSFNIFLRMFQLGLQVILAYWASKHEDTYQQCDYTIPNIISYIAYALAGLNLISLIAVRCSSKFPRCFFFIIFFLDLCMAATFIVLQVVKGQHKCAAGKVFFQFSTIEAGIAIIVCFVILIMRLAWGGRYTNSPGNVVWAPLFLAYHWTEKFRIPMQIIGIVAAVISGLTLLIHLSTLIKTSTSTRKLLMGWWIFAILLLLALEGLAIYMYITAGAVTEYKDVHAKRTLGVFILVNALDILFWLWGMKTLDYEKGDQVRDDLFSQGKDYEVQRSRLMNQQSIIVSRNSQNIGTVR